MTRLRRSTRAAGPAMIAADVPGTSVHEVAHPLLRLFSARSGVLVLSAPAYATLFLIHLRHSLPSLATGSVPRTRGIAPGPVGRPRSCRSSALGTYSLRADATELATVEPQRTQPGMECGRHHRAGLEPAAGRLERRARIHRVRPLGRPCITSARTSTRIPNSRIISPLCHVG